jgi:hypothetical protein
MAAGASFTQGSADHVTAAPKYANGGSLLLQ